MNPSARRAAAVACLALSCLPAARASPEQDYILNCMGCHGARAEGVPGKIPPLANMLSRFMRTAAGRNYVLRVPGAASSALSDNQLAAVLNWLAVTYDSAASTHTQAPFTREEVAEVRHHPLEAVLATRSLVVRELASSGPAPAPLY